MTDPTPFEPVSTELDFPRYERRILDFWKSARIFEKSLTARDSDAPQFVFYEGPPTANGVPHNGHVLTRVMKDLFPRYQAMRGCRVLRKGGWDTHGLPVEVEVEKELRIHGKAAIEEYGVEPFVKRCIESVFRYTSDWESVTERLGFWVSLDDAYVTYHRSYVESEWWALRELFKKGLLYQGHKVVWWWAQGGTALSAAEVGLGYKEVADPSVYVAFPLLDDPETALVIWTTTPWTLPSNGYAAVKPGVDYDVVSVGDALPAKKGKKSQKPQNPREFSAKKLIVASALREALGAKIGRELHVLETRKGAALVGTRYRPPFDYYARHRDELRVKRRDGSEVDTWWRVIGEEFVTLDTGTGIVHIAPAFGEDDHSAHKSQLAQYEDPEEVELICAIQPDGTFTDIAGSYAGRWIKDCDKDLSNELDSKGLLLASELYKHEYPFCWRADDDPLIQMARPAWFIRTTALKDGAIANNRAVNWLPEHIKEGRFGDFLQNNVDWALSRERFWGTPLNVWVCSADEEHKHAPASVAEIEELNPEAFAHFRAAKEKDPELSDHLIVHKPWIDEVSFPCPKCQAAMRRVTEVIDCWFDSGCMPFAQWGYPHQEGSAKRFDDAFPADFISEAIDQTRGWFYSLLMISTLVFDEELQKKMRLTRVREYPLPYKTCIVLGHVCDKEGKKESKSKGNYTPPDIILDRVRMEFGVLDEAYGETAKPGEVLVGREDLEGMDLVEGVAVAAYRLENSDARRELRLRIVKKLPRRVAIVSKEDVEALGLSVVPTGLDTKPVEVPRLPAGERIVLEDEKTPAPGSDAFRWFFYASGPPWNNTRHSLKNVRMLQKDFVVKLRNVYSFFVIYANIDGWRPNGPNEAQPVADRALLDRWMSSELAIATRDVRRSLDEFLVYDAASRLVDLVDALSNWYVRRSRRRFYSDGFPQDKCDAYATLFDCLVTISKLIAPFVPFFSEEMYQNLVVRPKLEGARESVHLDDYPDVDEAAIDAALAHQMRAAREVVSLGLGVRTVNKLKVRQPLARVDVVFNDAELAGGAEAHVELIKDELNVHEARFMTGGHDDGAVAFRVKPNFRALGPRLGKRVQQCKKALESADGNELYAEFVADGAILVDLGDEKVSLSGEEVQVVVEAKEGFAAATGAVGVVVLHTTLTDGLVDEGLLRELLSRIQARRKDLQLEFTDRVELEIEAGPRLDAIAQKSVDLIKSEALATEIHFRTPTFDGHRSSSVGEEAFSLGLRLAVRAPA